MFRAKGAGFDTCHLPFFLYSVLKSVVVTRKNFILIVLRAFLKSLNKILCSVILKRKRKVNL